MSDPARAELARLIAALTHGDVTRALTLVRRLPGLDARNGRWDAEAQGLAPTSRERQADQALGTAVRACAEKR